VSKTVSIEIPEKSLIAFCRRNHIRELSLFGSSIRDDFRPESDLDVLVEFEPDAEIDLIEFSGMRLELMELFGRDVDLVTPAALKPLIKDSILSSRVVLYAI
jgi:predicted nucleotidyltransferase